MKRRTEHAMQLFFGNKKFHSVSEIVQNINANAET
jgi:hypothetical protein